MDSSPRTVLYIEDNPANFRLVDRLLRGEGYEVLHAQDGFEGVQRAVEERHRLDLILLDINLPGMDGYEAATRLKTIEGCDRIPIVAVTVNTLKGDRKRSLAAGCDGFIPKPIDIHSFPERVKEYICGKRDRMAAAEERFYLREHARAMAGRLESSLGQLRLTHEQIQHKDKLASLGEMAACVAHELNNPVTSISFAVQALLRDAPVSARHRQHLELIERNSYRIQRLGEGLTTFSRPSTGERGLVNLARSVEDALVLVEHELRSRGIAVVRAVPTTLPHAWGNEGQLSHVLVNLLRNAAHAIGGRTPKGDGGRGLEAGRVEVRAEEQDERFLRLSVADNGTGIHPEYQDRLFTPFFTTKPRGQGTGLGLYIVKQIIDDLGGRIELRSALGEGTTFSLLMPRRPAPGQA